MGDIREIKAAVVGTGFIGVVHVEALRRLGVEVTGIVGSSPERAAEKAAAAALPAPYPSFDAMLDDPAVDVVHLTTPNHLHFDQARAALAAGKHVVCEKPLAMTAAETGELLRLAEQSGLVHAVNFNIRFYAQCQEARARVRAGEIGDVRLVSGGYLQDWLLLDTDWNWRLDPAAGGALRAVGDIGSHWLDLVQFITGQHVEAVLADLTTFIPVRRRPTGSGGDVQQRHGRGHRRHADGDRGRGGNPAAVQRRRARRADRVAGVRGTQEPPGLGDRRLGERARVALGGARGALDRPPRPAERVASERARRLPAGHAEGFPDTFKHLYRAVYGAVAAGGPPPEPDYPTFADGHEEAVIGEAIARSHAEQRWVSVTPVPQEV